MDTTAHALDLVARNRYVVLSTADEDVTEPARLRLSVAEISEAWVLDQDSPVDQRAPVPLGGARIP